MKKNILIFFIFLSFSVLKAQNADSVMISNFFSNALSDHTAYKNLEYLTTKIGGRICGSPQAAAAVEWTKQVMQQLDADTVYLQKLMVHHWVRGDKETASITSKIYGSVDVHVCALGESVATPAEGITAEVVEVKSFEQLKTMGKRQLSGKIIFYNTVMDPANYNTFKSYREAGDFRMHGAAEAAKYGAVAVVVRSVTMKEDYSTHTGIMRYDTNGVKIPAVAISTKDANVLSERLKGDYELLFHLKTNCYFLPEAESYNVIAEIKGSQYPDEIIAVGAHLDAWDNGQGAHDDGAGCMQSMEVLRLFKQYYGKPQHTIRIIMFMDEEVAQRGAKKYAESVKAKNEKHLVAIESDSGGLLPIGFGIDSSPDSISMISKWKDLFMPYGIYNFKKGYGGVDIYYLKGLGFPRIGLMNDSQRYFDYQHAETDTFEAVNKREMQLGSAAITSLVYLIDKYGLKK